MTATSKAKRSTCFDLIGPFAARTGADGVTIAEGETAPSPALSGARSLCETQRTSSNPKAPSAAALPLEHPDGIRSCPSGRRSRTGSQEGMSYTGNLSIKAIRAGQWFCRST
jgi:hypothetical protein